MVTEASSSLGQTLATKGFATHAPLFSTSELERISRAADCIAGETPRAGMRSPIAGSVELARLTNYPAIRRIVFDILTNSPRPFEGRPPFVTRSILFDKSPEANWDVAWHQDTTICVRERIETPGFGPWSIKDGKPHVRPTAAVLERMVTLRIHLDDCDRNNGALHVIPGSHRLGILTEAQIAEHVQNNAPEICEVPAGGIMIMRPLLLHASKKSTKPDRRRVLHLEFAIDDLPNGLSWNRELPDGIAP